MNFLLALSVIIALPVFIMLCILLVVLYKELHPKTLSTASYTAERAPKQHNKK